jgi:hypothetical protein
LPDVLTLPAAPQLLDALATPWPCIVLVMAAAAPAEMPAASSMLKMSTRR